jgi:hypothetical protein
MFFEFRQATSKITFDCSSSEWQVERAQLLAMIQVLEAQQNERVAESAPAVHVAPVDSAQDAPVNTPLTSSQSELLDSAKVAEVKSMLKKISSLKQELNSARDKRSSSKYTVFPTLQ